MSTTHRSDKRAQIESKITKRDSLRFCEEFIDHVSNPILKRNLETAKKLAVSSNYNWTSFIITLDNRINIMFYHNKNAKDKNKRHIIKIAHKMVELTVVSNILPDELACKTYFSDEDYELIVLLVYSVYIALKSNSNEIIKMLRR